MPHKTLGKRLGIHRRKTSRTRIYRRRQSTLRYESTQMPCKTSRRRKSNRHIRPTAKSNHIGTIGSILRRRSPNRRRHDYTTAVKIQKTSSRYYHRQYQRGSFLMQNYRLFTALVLSFLKQKLYIL